MSSQTGTYDGPLRGSNKMDLVRYVAVKLGQTEKERKHALEIHSGKEVLVMDSHDREEDVRIINQGMLNYRTDDPEVYHVLSKNLHRRRFHVHDLEELFVRIPFP